MQNEDEQLYDDLLNNIRKGLEVYGPKRFNQSVISLLGVKKDDSVKIQKIIKQVCAEYKISHSTLISSNERGDVYEAKRIVICLLFFETNMKVRAIASKIFQREWHSFATKCIKKHRTLNLIVKADKEYKQRYDKIQKIISQN